MIVLLLALETIAVDPVKPVALADITFDLRDTRSSTSDGAILVIGRRYDERIEPLPPGFEPEPGTPPMGRIGSGGFTMDFKPTLMANGTTSNRMMITFRKKF